MNDVGFALIQLGYHLGLAVVIGGGTALAAFAAPAIFRGARDRSEAGAVFGEILARYDGVATFAVLLVWATTYLRASGYETADATHYVRWTALALMGLATLYGSAWADPVARSIRRQTPGFGDLPAAHPARREFAALHRRSTRALALAIIFGIVALFLS